MGTESGHEVPAPWNDGLKVMFHKAGQDINSLKGIALTNTAYQNSKTYHQGLKGGMGGRKKEEEGRIHERISLS